MSFENSAEMQLGRARDEFLNGYFSTHNRRKKTKAAYHSDLVQFIRFAGETRELPSLDGAIIEQWAAHLRQDGYAPASIRRKIIASKVFCSYWLRKGALAESPFWRVKLSFGRIEQLPRTLTEGETQAMLAHASLTCSSPEPIPDQAPAIRRSRSGDSLRSYRALRNLALVDLLLATGMRVGETSALDICDFCAVRRRLVVT